MSLPFDRVVITLDGAERLLESAQFLALPLHVRVRHLLHERLRFMRGDEQVDRRTCLQALAAAARVA
jgi:hypothetical protein